MLQLSEELTVEETRWAEQVYGGKEEERCPEPPAGKGYEAARDVIEEESSSADAAGDGE